MDEAVPRRRWASAEGQHGAVSSGPALAMPGKAQQFQGPQVSCCAKYLLFASNVLFWVGEREQASESRPAEAVGRSVGAALAPLPLGRRGGGQDGWSDWALAAVPTSVAFAVKSGGLGAAGGRDGGRSLASWVERKGSCPSPSCGILGKGSSRQAGARGVRMVPRRVERGAFGARKFLGKDVLWFPSSLSLRPICI